MGDSMSKYKHLLFDLDNTLVDDNKNRKYAISKVLDYLNYNYTEETLNSFILSDNEYWKKMGRREFDYMRPSGMDAKETFKWAGGNRIRYFLKDLSFNKCVELNNLYMEYMKEKVFPIEGSKETLSELKKMGYLLYIITNGPEKAAFIKRDSISKELFENIIASENIGYMKPHKEFYDAMYKKFNIYSKEEMLIIGDELDKDILGGNNENIDTVWLNRYNHINDNKQMPTYEIKDIKELNKILKK